MKNYFLGLITLGVLATTACKNDATVTPEEVHYKVSDFEKTRNDKKAQIDSLLAVSPNDNYSLNYRNESGVTYTAVERLNADNKVAVYELNTTFGDESSVNKTTFYMDGDHPFMTVERFDNTEKAGKPEFVERIAYFEANGKVKNTKMRSAGSEDELEAKEFEPTENGELSLTLVQDILQRKGKFELTFQGFILSDESLDFLLVGGPGVDGFSSAIQIEHYDAFINEAKKNQEKNLNRKVIINFHIEEVNGYEYQVYDSGAWAE